MIAQIHKGERILPAADNAELFSRLQNPQENAYVLQQALIRVTEELQGLRVEQRQVVLNTSKTAQGVSNITSEDGTALTVVIRE
jgi:adenine C2-methylase RlmN of 23S rRNA A2503 and tRNA A37